MRKKNPDLGVKALMPTIAQKLCHDIVEPGIKPSEETVKSRSSGKFINTCKRHNIKTPNAGYMEKTRIPKIDPPYTSSSSIKSQKPGVTILKKKIADSAVNTLVSGPLRCDNNCVTALRKRNHQGTCKCNKNRKTPKVSAKEIQTLNKAYYALSDKACTQCVETVSCGTQFLDNKGRMSRQNSISEKRLKTPVKLSQFEEQYSKHEPYFDKYKCLRKDSSRNQPGGICTTSKPSLRYISAKRWALTNYPTRGPDF